MPNLKTANVIFEDSQYNYSTSVNGKLSDQEIKKYFIGMSVNVAPYPKEVFKTVVDCTVEPFDQNK